MNDNKLETLAQSLLKSLESQSESLISMSQAATGNSRTDTIKDLESAKSFLRSFRQSDVPQMRKPKGEILLILSFNEPLLLSVVPIFCALAAGNKIIVRPSGRNTELLDFIWAESVIEFDLPMQTIDIAPHDFGDVISKVRCVYFFGSHAHAKELYKVCAEYHVEFVPEVETADTKVLYYSGGVVSDSEIDNQIEVTLRNAFDHNGKMCQRISGLFVSDMIYSLFLERLQIYTNNKGYVLVDDSRLQGSTTLNKDILDAKPRQIYQKEAKTVIIQPGLASNLVDSAYFEESLWALPYSSVDTLASMLNSRTFKMGLNIVSNDTKFANQLIDMTFFSRYTLGKDHCDISKDLGWGGNWPSGSGGYKSWYESFSNSYVIIP